MDVNKYDNSVFVNAVYKLRGQGIASKNKDIALALDYSEGTISELMKGKKPVSKR